MKAIKRKSLKKKAETRQLCAILWKDPTTHPIYMEKGDVKNYNESIILTIGMLIEDTQERVKVCMTDGKDSFADVFVVPRSLIIQMNKTPLEDSVGPEIWMMFNAKEDDKK